MSARGGDTTPGTGSAGREEETEKGIVCQHSVLPQGQVGPHAYSGGTP